MTKPIYKSVLAGALLMVVSAIDGFGQYSPQPPYQNQGNVAPQLDNLVAPVALYPDSLLSQVLVACTYPGQLAAAGQWLSQAGYLQGEQRLEAAQQQNWDPSVQALVAFPDVLQRLNQDPQWASELGNAFLNNQGDVMNAVQEMRARAQQSGRLQSTQQQTVNVENYGGERAIEIVSANPEVLYVPSYDPAYIWGAPAYGYYPSLSYPSWGFGFGGGIALSGFFGGYGGYGNRYGGWGWGSNWHDRRVTVNNDFFYRNRFNGYQDGRYSSGSNIWRHDNNRGNSFAGGTNRGYSNQQQSFNGNNYRQQGFRSNQQVAPQQQYSQPRSFQQAPQQQYSQSFGRTSQQQYSQPRSFQQNQQQQYSQPRSFQPSPQQQYSQPRSFQQAPHQQYSRPAQSQPQQQRSEQRSFSRNDHANAQRSDQQSNFAGGRNRR